MAACAWAATLLASLIGTHGAATCGEATRPPKLQYSWTPGKDLAYQFEIEAEVQGSFTTFKGTSVYRPRIAQDRANQREETGTGTAFVVNGNGYLVTCAHVVRGGKKFVVRLGQTEMQAKVLEMDRDHDLALLQVLPTSKLTVLPLGDSQKVQLAQTVRAIGFPLSTVLGNSIKITSGSIAGLVDHEGQRLFQVDAAINPGNSGGPVVNDRGEVIGVASAKLAGAEISNVGFAVPVQEVRRLLERNQVIDPAVGAADALSGPELAQRVTPGVGLITVTTGPGGLGSTEHFELGFEGSREQWKRAKKYSLDGATLVLKNDMVSGRTVTDPLGEIHDGSGSWLPLGLGPQCQVGIERFPDSTEKTTWRVRRLTTISEVISQSPMPLPNMPFRGPPMRPFGPAFRGGGQAVIVIPAFQQIEYQLGSTSAGLVTIKKRYEFKVAEAPGEPSPLNVTAEGTLRFDPRSGAVQSLAMVGKLVSDAKGSSTTIPFSYKYQQIDPASLRTRTITSTPAPLPATSSLSRSSQRSRSVETPRIVDPPKDRQPVPGKTSRDKAAELVEEVFGEQLRKARHPKDKLALVDQLLDAAGSEKDVTQRYALLNQARLLAVGAGDLAAARRAADEMIAFFQIDPRKANLALLQAVAETAAGSQHAAVAEFAMTLLEDSIADDRFDAAEQAAPIALRAAREAGEVKLLRRVQQRSRDLKRLHKAFDAIQDDRETLDRNPNQPDANLAVGKYYCLEKRDWDKGLPMLALGSDRNVKEAAEKDLAPPTTPDQCVALADRWWDLSDQFEGDAQEAVLGRALKWYEEALPSLNGLTRARVEKRLEKYANLIPKEKEIEASNRATNSSRNARLARNARSAPARPFPATSAAPTLGGTAANGETALAGGFGEAFREVGPEGSLLVGLEVGLGKFGDNDVIRSVRAIFRTRDGSEVFSRWHGQDTARVVRVRAKSGYAVGGLSTKFMALLDGFSVTFMRVGGRNLITGDSYESSWVGGPGGSRELRLGGDGSPVIGIIGRENSRECTALGLLLKR